MIHTVTGIHTETLWLLLHTLDSSKGLVEELSAGSSGTLRDWVREPRSTKCDWLETWGCPCSHHQSATLLPIHPPRPARKGCTFPARLIGSRCPFDSCHGPHHHAAISLHL
ncbi:unnamed protein product [Pleuronectes platessa]|uniref:Uncharacterized protein n=1 Tax=Pleuronectes platessa TaxID=8262 RepID=A0A9N7V619_PLEPL|nr:unnamed protein product [Pleuronectes platessa]